MNGTRMFRLLAAVLCLALPLQVHATWTFSEGEWDTASWTMTIIEQKGTSSASATRQTSEGNPDAFRSVTQFTGVSSLIRVFHSIPALLYDPRVSGAIASLDFALDSKPISGTLAVHGFGVIVKQANSYYFGPGGNVNITPNAWETFSAQGLGAADFDLLTATGIDTNSHPDFGASAAPLVFGFFTQNSISLTQVAGYDNLRLTITPVPEPEAYAMLLVGLGLLGFLARFRKHQTA